MRDDFAHNALWRSKIQISSFSQKPRQAVLPSALNIQHWQGETTKFLIRDFSTFLYNKVSEFYIQKVPS